MAYPFVITQNPDIFLDYTLDYTMIKNPIKSTLLWPIHLSPKISNAGSFNKIPLYIIIPGYNILQTNRMLSHYKPTISS